MPGGQLTHGPQQEAVRAVCTMGHDVWRDRRRRREMAFPGVPCAAGAAPVRPAWRHGKCHLACQAMADRGAGRERTRAVVPGGRRNPPTFYREGGSTRQVIRCRSGRSPASGGSAPRGGGREPGGPSAGRRPAPSSTSPRKGVISQCRSSVMARTRRQQARVWWPCRTTKAERGM